MAVRCLLVILPVPSLDERLADPARLAALERTGLLDTQPEEPFDRLTRLAAKLLRVPVTFISLLDRDRDFYKSAAGLPEPLASTRQLQGRTFCHHTLESQAPLVIDDTTVDPVYRAVPTVDTLGVRAYAGVPLISEEGHALGSFCAIDFAPRRWTPQDIEVLSELALSAMNEIALREALRQSADNLRLALDSVRARESVLGLVAHDLRNPLSILSMSTVVLSARPELAAHAEVFARMGRATHSMNALIGELLDFSSSSSRPILLERVRTDPAALVRDVAAMLAPLADRYGVELLVRAQDGLAEVSIDYERILRVFSNLIGNALKVSPRGGSIELAAEADGSDEVVFSVADHGPGMSPSDIERVFDPFWQKDPGDSRGVGLGLSIVKSYVEAHGGVVTVNSVEGSGCRFRFTLPTAPVEAKG